MADKVEAAKRAESLELITKAILSVDPVVQERGNQELMKYVMMVESGNKSPAMGIMQDSYNEVRANPLQGPVQPLGLMQ